MTRQDILQFITANPAFSLATCEADQPRVRKIQLYRADENGIIFAVGRAKGVCQQLKANPAMEMCFFSAENGMQIRITGKAEEIDDLELKKQIVEEYSFLKPWIEAEGYDVLATFTVKDAVASPWTMKTNFKPKQFIEL